MTEREPNDDHDFDESPETIIEAPESFVGESLEEVEPVASELETPKIDPSEPAESNASDSAGEQPEDESTDSISESSDSKITTPPSRASYADPPLGLRLADADGLEVFDGLAGLISNFGLGFSAHRDAFLHAAQCDWGNAFSPSMEIDRALTKSFAKLFAGHTLADLTWASAHVHCDLAREAAIAYARGHQGGKRYRTIALVGSDHGRTGVCRTASGLPSLRQGYGPLMAGFSHVSADHSPADDLKALKTEIDDRTGGILISPLVLSSAGRPLQTDFITGVRQLCDEEGLLLIVDETDFVFGSAGTPLAVSSLADIQPDLAIVAGGLFGGISGGLLLNWNQTSSLERPTGTVAPLQSALAIATADAMTEQQVLQTAAQRSHEVAVQIAQAVAGFEFVRDVYSLGSSISIETDLESNLLLEQAISFGLRAQAAGPTAIRFALPIVVPDQDASDFVSRVAMWFEATETLPTVVA